jgi:KTSC domain
MAKRRSYRDRISDWFADIIGVDGGGNGPLERKKPTSVEPPAVSPVTPRKGASWLVEIPDNEDFEWLDVSSSNVYSIGWHELTGELRIRFHKDGTPKSLYRYPEFPKDQYEEFVAAPSYGKWVYWVLRNGGNDDLYYYERLE